MQKESIMSEADSEAGDRPRFEFFRGAEARDYASYEAMAIDGVTPTIAAGLAAFAEAGGGSGQTVEMLYSRPGMSLTRVWFKSGYPLPLHTHNADCLYVIIAGSIEANGQTYGPGDGFFVGSEVPYTYTPGPEGVEVFEFRAADAFNIQFKAKGEKAWANTVERLEQSRERWQGESRPSAREHANG
jgi:hypothetical protein